MEKRLVTFFLATAITLLIYGQLVRWMNPPMPNQPQIAQNDGDPQDEENEQNAEANADDFEPNEGDETNDSDNAPNDGELVASTESAPEKRIALGSLAEDSPYQMLATLNSKGGSIECIELNNPRYTLAAGDSGYLGSLALSDVDEGCLVNVVGAGTPAHQATGSDGTTGLKAGDILVQFNGEAIIEVADFRRRMKETKPNDETTLRVLRDNDHIDFTVQLRRPPLAVISPEPEVPTADHPQHPLSYLLTLAQIGNRTAKIGRSEIDKLPSLFEKNWNAEVIDDRTVEFTFVLGTDALEKLGVEGSLEIVKRYSLSKIESTFEDSDEKKDLAAYHLELDVEFRNTGSKPIEFAYRVDGPSGLPLEGSWYAYKTHPSSWGAAGLRDLIAKNSTDPHDMFTNAAVIKQADNPDSPNLPLFAEPSTVELDYVGVDALYFTSALLPEKNEDGVENKFSAIGRLVGPVMKERKSKTDLSFRIDSEPINLAAGKTHTQKFTVFAGPKSPEVLSAYGLENAISHGWFKRVSIPLTYVLHFFYGIVGNYGISIILLTVLVRACLLPFGRQQALNAQRMQELAPEMKKIAEKYKDDMEKRATAQRELFRKNNYNPLAGCLPMLFQLPIFIGLYRALSVDIELRQAPLIPGIRWCSNLASPDQFMRWDSFMPSFLGSESGFLGPYLNILPLISVALMLVQQKLFTPPAQDDQQAMQLKMMKMMTVFFGFLFFRVPAGLCLYFITSSLWGIAERKLIPKPKLKPQDAATDSTEPSKKPLVSLSNKSKKAAPSREAIIQERKKRQKQRKK